MIPHPHHHAVAAAALTRHASSRGQRLATGGPFTGGPFATRLLRYAEWLGLSCLERLSIAALFMLARPLPCGVQKI